MVVRFKGIKTAAEYRRGEITKDVLRLIGAGVVAAGAIMAPNSLQIIDMFNPKNPRERNRVWKALKYLESKQKIAFEQRGTHTYVHLTDKGRIQLDEQSIWEMSIDEPRRWDKKWRIVMFDIPGKNESARQSFRMKLVDFGLRMYQRSVFIYPHECYEHVMTVAKWYGLERHVRYVVAEEINETRRYLKEFDLI